MAEPHDMKDLLEAERRSVAPRPGGFDRLMRRRRRRQTSQRLGAAMLALVLAGAATWGVAIAFRGQPAHGPARPAPTIDTSTATRLHVAWSYASPDLLPIKPPAVGGGVVLLLGHEHLLRAYPATCRLRVCTAMWKFQLPLLVSDSQPSGPVISAGEAYVFLDRLYAFDLPCGQACRPAWTSAASGIKQPERTLVVDGSLVLVAVDRGVEVFDVARCRRLRSTCRPSWTYRVPGGASGVAVGDGIVVATSPTGVYAFVHPCARDTCSPTWTDPGGSSAGNPAIAGGVVYVVSGSELRAYAADCAGQTCSPSWRTSIASTRTLSDPVVADGRVWVAGDRLFGYAAGRACPDAPCSPAFTGPSAARGSLYAWAPPVVVGGVVFTASGRPTAFDASCVGRCRPLWEGPVPGGPPAPFLAPMANEHTVFFVQSRPDAVLVAYPPLKDRSRAYR